MARPFPNCGLVLLHGFTGGPASFDELALGLGRRFPGLRVARPALLGHSGRGPSEGFRFQLEVERLARSIRAARLSGCHLCGYSLGGRLALGLLASFPWLVSGATLIGAHPGLASLAARRLRAGQDERWCRLLESRGIHAFCQAWESQPLFESQRRVDAARLERQRAVRRAHDPRGLARALRSLGLGQMPSCWDAPRLARRPVTLLAGERDAKFRALGEALASRGGAVVARTIDGAGHNLVLEAPESVEAVLTEALTS